jgi:hypothetical protein
MIFTFGLNLSRRCFAQANPSTSSGRTNQEFQTSQHHSNSNSNSTAAQRSAQASPKLG